jgi:asparagine synthase (glutamine-hydrolysing)
MVILISENNGWQRYQKLGIDIWFKGGHEEKGILNLADSILTHNNASINTYINSMRGHFAIIIKTLEEVIVAVDRVSSIPLFYAKYKNKTIISNNAKLIINKYGDNFQEIDKKSFLEMFMSGYTIGRKTLFQNIYRLQAGEYAHISKDSIKVESYYTYSPFIKSQGGRGDIKDRFEYSILQPMQQLINDADGRPIVVPLSAGKDSRLVISSLKYLGAKNICCFAYGRKNAFESKISKAVADKLGVKWIHVPITIKGQWDYFKSIEFREYASSQDTLSSITFLQDVYAVRYLFLNGLISSNSIIVNGNTGDFLSGGHVLPVFGNQKFSNNSSRVQTAWDQYLDKHYSLWGGLRNEENDRHVKEESIMSLKERKIDISSYGDNMFGYFETLEYLQRQSKYVVNMQRSYDFYGFEWRMPLWDELAMDFWEGVELRDKLGQSFYTEALRHFNWGGVWKDVPINNYSNKVHPYWIRPVRNFLKLFFMASEKDAWRQFEKNKLFYFMDDASNMAIVPYSRVFMDKRGFRNDFSWIAEEYLATYDLKWEMIENRNPL